MTRTKSLFAALSVALLLAAGDARAAFTYSVAVTTTPVAPATGGGTTPANAFNTIVFGQSNYIMSGQTSTGTLTGLQTINLVQANQNSTRPGPPPATDTTTIPTSLAVTINSVGNGSGVITVAGTLNITRSDMQGANSTFTLTSILPAFLTLGQTTYDLSAPVYTAPTINSLNANAGISITINERAIPEPASVVMMGMGALALGGLTVLRRRRQA